VVLKYGEIVEQGNHEELVNMGGVYKNLVDRQMTAAKVEEMDQELAAAEVKA
jgi:ABC-type transport system involved in cytochrome bd biosynthesis fused ATPase/permease subunit